MDATGSGRPPRGRVTRADAQAKRAAKREDREKASAGELDDDPATTASKGPDKPPPGRAGRAVRAGWKPVVATGGLQGAMAITAALAWPWMLLSVAIVSLGSVGTALVAGNDDDEKLVRYLLAAAGAIAWSCIAAPVEFGGWIDVAFRALPVAGAITYARAEVLSKRKPDPGPMLQLEGPPAEEPELAEAEPADFKDPRQAQFEAEFRKGSFEGLEVSGWRNLGDKGDADRGFTFKISFPSYSRVGVSAFDNDEHRKAMAMMWSTIPAAIVIDHDREGEYAHNPSETHGQITIPRAVPRTAARVAARPRFESTYDPKTGLFEIGRFPSGRAHLVGSLLPQGGCQGFQVIGPSGKGKTAAGNIILSRYGLATDERGNRLFALAVGDTQGCMTWWAENALMYADGPLATVHMMRIIHKLGESRLEWNKTAEFVVKGQVRRGRGWSVPEKGWPGIISYIGELAKLNGGLVLDAGRMRELGKYTLAGAQENRKVSMATGWEAQTGYIDAMGPPELRDAMDLWNKLLFAARSSATAGQLNMGGREPLPPGFGYCFVEGPDNIRDACQIDFLPYEDEDPSQEDAWDVAARVGAMPVELSEADIRVLKAFGWSGEGCFRITEQDCLDWEAAVEAEAFKNQQEDQAAIDEGSGGIVRPPIPLQEVSDLVVNLDSGDTITTSQIAGELKKEPGLIDAACAVLARQGQIKDLGGDVWQAAA